MGSLASNTGPPPPGTIWSNASRQWVHLGEEVAFDFVLHDLRGRRVDAVGWADYGVATIQSDRIEVEPDSAGRFQFSYRFDHAEPGEQIDVHLTAYRQRGSRDFMNVQGRWLRSANPGDQPDQKVAADAIQMTLYLAPIELAIEQPPDEFDPNTGVLRFDPSSRKVNSIYVNRPDRPGFTLTRPNAEGFCIVHYQPKGNELNASGETKVHFLVYDVAGNPHDVTRTFKTP